MLRVKRLDPAAKLPIKKAGDAAYDLFSLDSVWLKAGERALVRTGIACDFPPGYVARLCDRSGVALNQGLHVVAGVVDQTYRGEWMVAFYNMNNYEVKVPSLERIAQVLFYKVEDWPLEEVADLDETERGSGGFGSTGSK